MKEQISMLVFDALTEMSEELDGVDLTQVNADTRLYGGILDSLGLVRLVAEVESKILETYGKTVVLADEKAMSQVHSPFKSINNLVDFTITLINESGVG